MRMSAQQIVELLQLQSPTTCGFVSEPYRSAWQVPQSALPPGYEGSRPLGNVFYFLVTPEAQVRLHRIRSDQMYHHYLGDPLEVLLLYADGRSEVKVVGGDLSAGHATAAIHPRRHLSHGPRRGRRRLRAVGYVGLAARRAERRRNRERRRLGGEVSGSARTNSRHSPVEESLPAALVDVTSDGRSLATAQELASRVLRRPRIAAMRLLPLHRAVVVPADVEAAVRIVTADCLRRPRVEKAGSASDSSDTKRMRADFCRDRDAVQSLRAERDARHASNCLWKNSFHRGGVAHADTTIWGTPANLTFAADLS